MMQIPIEFTAFTLATAPAAPAAGPAVNPADALRGAAGTTAAPGMGGAATGPAQQSQGIPPLFWMLPLFLFLLIGMQVLAGRKERRKRETLLSALKRNDRVLTIGGIIGIVAEVRDDEIVLRIDENSNVRIRVTRSAIQQVLRSAEGSPEPDAPAVEVRSRADRVAN